MREAGLRARRPGANAASRAASSPSGAVLGFLPHDARSTRRLCSSCSALTATGATKLCTSRLSSSWRGSARGASDQDGAVVPASPTQERTTSAGRAR
ncbi:hypothetical protein [Streptomyces sp. NPDC006925]|uniref:hypothetical protein n=1 Tax=Streptomyces sp. NPDC006925 TaxID=3364768 RepID=UPI0036BAD027